MDAGLSDLLEDWLEDREPMDQGHGKTVDDYEDLTERFK